ncbi:MAG: pyridoxal phosphate-dependent aminotransferase [Boseongicola sp.]|nr:pyridoxal phosphate-dependent aminotransferase [Boseongicola sp.]
MKISKRIQGLTGGGSDGWDIYRRSRAMIADGKDVIELTIGEHDRRTEPEILTAMYEAALGGHTGYSSIPGISELRDAIAVRTTERTGIKTERENILVTPGGQAALFAAHMVACDPGDTGLFIDPYYATYPGTIRAVGAVARPVPARARFGFQPQWDDIAQDAGSSQSLLINSPNNPTGVVYSEDTMNTIVRAAQEFDLWLVSDEVYDSQLWSGTHLSPRQWSDMTERTLVVGSVSKSNSMTGSRFVWIIGPEEAIDHLSNLSTHTNYGVPGFIQDAAVFALSQGPEFEDRIAKPFRRRHAAVGEYLMSRQVKVVPSTASMYLMVDIRSTGLSGEEFANRLLDDHLIAVMPGESFGASGAGHLRIALTIDDERLMTAAAKITDMIQALASEAA